VKANHSPAWLVFILSGTFAFPTLAEPGAITNGLNELQSTWELSEGAIIRAAPREKKLALVFTGHEFAEGAEAILEALSRHRAKGSFFFTGQFLSNSNFGPIVERVLRDGHYLGPHSDRHLLYCSWDKNKKLLVTREEFRTDLEANLAKIYRTGFERAKVRFFLPPYEQFNAEIAQWTREEGLQLINFTPGTRSNADYTGEAETNFVSSKTIFESITSKEQHDPNGLNGFILLLHIGSGPKRTDKFHRQFSELLEYLGKKGYQFVSVEELLR